MQARQRAQPTGTNRPTRTTTPHTPPAQGGGANPPRPLRSPGPTHPPPHTRGGAGHPGPPQPHPHPGGHSGAGKRPDPYRTRKLSPPAPMVLPPPGSGRAGHHRETHHHGPAVPPHGDDGATTIPPPTGTTGPRPSHRPDPGEIPLNPHRPPRPQQPRNETLHGPQQARAGLPRSIGIVPPRLRTSREGAPGGLGLLQRPPLLARRRAGTPPQGRRSPSCGAGARRGPRMAR